METILIILSIVSGMMLLSLFGFLFYKLLKYEFEKH